MPSWITCGFFSFFPSLRELTKRSGHVEQSQQAGLFPFMLFCPLEAKAVPLLTAWVVPRVPLLPRAPCSPGADVVQDWIRCPFPYGGLGFLFNGGNEPRPLALCPSRLFKLLLQLEEDSAAVARGRRPALASPFYQLLRKAGELCLCTPPPVVVKMSDDDRQFGMLYSALLLLEGGWSASVEVFQGHGNNHRVMLVFLLKQWWGLPHRTPGLLQAEVAHGEGSGETKSILSTMSLMAILKYSGK